MEGVLYKWTNYLSGECGPRCVRPGPRLGYWVQPASRARSGVHLNLANWAGGGLAWAAAPLQGAEPVLATAEFQSLHADSLPIHLQGHPPADRGSGALASQS